MKFRLQGITDLSTVDWPGRLAAVIFLQGCNLRCPWCQNPDGVDPEGGRAVTTKEVVEHLKELRPMIDSVVLTGGEPLIQSKACLELLKGAKELELSRAIETNASKPKALRQLLPWLDFVAIDIKAPVSNARLYDEITGSTGAPELTQKIRESLIFTINSDAEVEARTTVVPTLNDASSTIERIVAEIEGVSRFCLQQFRNVRTLDPAFQKYIPPTRQRMLELAKIAKERGIKEVRISTSKVWKRFRNRNQNEPMRIAN